MTNEDICTFLLLYNLHLCLYNTKRHIFDLCIAVALLMKMLIVFAAL